MISGEVGRCGAAVARDSSRPAAVRRAQRTNEPHSRAHENFIAIAINDTNPPHDTRPLPLSSINSQFICKGGL
ncbi:unnamed protein product [Pieris brassicae]|uniref:Uncharacterized protein n=1 Tax=Pieris brassicae TaxID=7116 RepID=A0A9P0XD51_PIEBR|nr:unnamed protein product [Pieris brassicae]